jgi:hypothetical protein
MRANWKSDRQDPILVNARMDIELPNVACSSWQMVDPNRANPKTEIPDPICTIARIEIVDPMVEKSNME